MLLIYTTQKSARLAYVLAFVSQQCGLTVQVTNDKPTYESATLPKINYSNETLLAEEIQIVPHSLLTETTIRPQSIKVSIHNGYCCFFQTQRTAAIPFDLFAAIFYLLSRYEEYLATDFDTHDRFSATSSVAAQAGFLHLPIIDIWLADFKVLLKKKFPELQFPPTVFQCQPTFDVDLAWAYLNRSFVRTAAATARDLWTGKWQERVKVYLRQSPDPFFTFPYLMELHRHFSLSPIFFFLLGNYNQYDKNTAPKNKNLQKLIKELEDDYELGIHPSYASNESKELLQLEVNRLAGIVGRKVHQSRQHYLKLSLPVTYQRLIAVGIEKDYTMGYADAIGFRAGTSHPFKWYDLSKEATTALMIHPFQVMDVSLKEYLQYTPEKAIEVSVQMASLVKQYGGTFTLLWHNSSFARIGNWQAWKPVYETILSNIYEDTL